MNFVSHSITKPSINFEADDGESYRYYPAEASWYIVINNDVLIKQENSGWLTKALDDYIDSTDFSKLRSKY